MEDSARPAFGALLRRYRLDANLTQKALAVRCHLSVQAISMLERGTRRSPRRDTAVRLSRALRLDPERTEALLAASEAGQAGSGPPRPTVSLPTGVLPPHAPLPPDSRMPLAPNPLFVGRADELLQVASALMEGGATVALGQVVASTGLGGVGKTQLAVELVHRCGRYFAGGVFWLSFASPDEIPLQVAACAGPGAMDLASGIENRSLEERVERVQRAWQSAVPRLLVFDNCEHEDLLDAWRPRTGGCRVLVTSRRAHWSPTLGVTNLPLHVLPRAHSIELLRRYRPNVAPDDPCLDAIALELGDLPLALHLAGSYLRAYRAEVSLGDYLAALRQSDVVQHASLLGAGLDDSISPTGHAQGVAQTFALCLSRLDREREVDQVAIALLARLACMAPGEPAPRDLLGKTLNDVDPLLRADALRRLGAVGLVEEGESWLRLHRLLAHFIRRNGMDPDAQPAVARALIGCAEDAEAGHLTGPALAAVVPHLVEMAGAAGRATGDGELAAELCNSAGQALRFAGDLRAARPWYERALAIREREMGPDHSLTASSLNNLAELQCEHGELAAARPLFERALAIRERALGPGHPDTAESLNDLGIVLRDLGDPITARPLLERALDIHERTLGIDHPNTAVSLDNLAGLLKAQGELAAARILYERALGIAERVLGPEHPDTAASLNNLAGLLQAQGELPAARVLYERALGIAGRVLGPDHPDTTHSLNGLARVLQAQGELTAARALLERTLAIWERVLGPYHPYTAASLDDLAFLLRDVGELDTGKALLERALDIRQRKLGPDHPDTAIARSNLANLADRGLA